MKTLGSLIACVAAALLVATTVPAYAVDRVDLSRPGTIERGDDVRIPHLDGRTIVDGDTRIEVPGALALMGLSGEDYLVQTRRDGKYRVERVSPDGSATVLLAGKRALHTELTGDGRYVLRNDNSPAAVITAYDATDGSEMASRSFRRYGSVIGSGDGIVYVTRWSPAQRTFAWDVAADTRTVVVDQYGSIADVDADRISVYTGDPYEDGCLQVRQLSDPETLVWESCTQRVTAFSPDGALMATIHILSDGIGPGEVQLREADGTLLVRYAATWFGATRWEDADTLLLEANGKRRGATVRCDGTDCERASDVERVSP